MENEQQGGDFKIKRFSPWVFIPILYFLQAIPVTVVQELSTIIFKDFGIENEPITRWTSLIALPWALQMLLGPMVDLNFTKRKWILNGQLVIAAGLIGTAFLLQTPNAFEFSLVVLGATAVVSALCNIATDGFAILSMDRTDQARFAGIMSTCYRLGRLFCAALLVFVAGMFMKLPPLKILGAHLPYQVEGVPGSVTQVELIVDSGKLVGYNGEKPIGFEITVPPGTFGLAVNNEGAVIATTLKETKEVGRIPLGDSGRIVQGSTVQTRNPKTVWFLVLLGGGILYGLLHLVARKETPFPDKDEAAAPVPGETRRNLIRTLSMLMVGIGGYFGLNAAVRLIAHGIWSLRDGTSQLPGMKEISGLQGWRLTDENKIPILNNLSYGGVGTEVFQFCLCLAIAAIGFFVAKRTISGSEMGKALGSFVTQQGFGAIFLFILFYRFPEALVGKINPLFLKDALDKGGLAIDNAQLGILSGLVGVVGIILGGIVGGFTVSKIGLRKSFIPLVLAMNVPNVLYLLLTMNAIPMSTVQLNWPGPLNITLGGILFVDQFGYGFGFAGYMVYLMWVAQRGSFTTSHYAIGTGMGALCIAIAGVLSGVLQSNFGYQGTYIAVLLLSIPGLLSLLLIPLDDSHKQIKVEVE